MWMLVDVGANVGVVREEGRFTRDDNFGWKKTCVKVEHAGERQAEAHNEGNPFRRFGGRRKRKHGTWSEPQWTVDWRCGIEQPKTAAKSSCSRHR